MIIRLIIRSIFVWILVLQWIIFIPEACSTNISSLKDKKNIVIEMLREKKSSGEELPPEVTEEVTKARQARMEKNWVALEKALDRIIKYLSGDAKETKWTLAPQEQNILADADSRIEKYRMATCYLTFVTPDGRSVPEAKVTIKQIKHEFLFGCNRSLSMQSTIYLRKYGSQVPRYWRKGFNVSDEDIEKYMKKFVDLANYTQVGGIWNVYERRKGEIKYDLFDQEIEWLRNAGFTLGAGHLVWNNYTPSWVPDDCVKMVRAIKKRVSDFVSHYRKKIEYFSVVNEATMPFRPHFEKDKMTKCFRKFGIISFASMPFRVAREVDPSAKLVINEVAVLERQGFPDLLKNLKDTRGNPLYDVIGVQSHMHSRLWPLNYVWEICERYSAFRVPIHFTEVSILSGTPLCGRGYGKETTPEGERKQAEYAVKFYTLLFSHPSVEAIQWWDFTDLGAWKGAPAGLLRKDMSAKPTYNALMGLIKETWWTNVHTTTSKHGQCQFKGFYGIYRVTVSLRSGESRSFNVRLLKKGKRHFRLIL